MVGRHDSEFCPYLKSNSTGTVILFLLTNKNKDKADHDATHNNNREPSDQQNKHTSNFLLSQLYLNKIILNNTQPSDRSLLN